MPRAQRAATRPGFAGCPVVCGRGAQAS